PRRPSTAAGRSAGGRPATCAASSTGTAAAGPARRARSSSRATSRRACTRRRSARRWAGAAPAGRGPGATWGTTARGGPPPPSPSPPHVPLVVDDIFRRFAARPRPMPLELARHWERERLAFPFYGPEVDPHVVRAAAGRRRDEARGGYVLDRRRFRPVLTDVT